MRTLCGMRAILSTAFLISTAHYTFAQSSSSTAPPSITVYWAPGQTPFLSPNETGLGVPTPTSLDQALPVYNTKTLIAPPPPGKSAMPTAFDLPVKNSVPSGASIQQSGSFFGFSIEMSVVNQVLGKNSSLIQVPFLNLMANIQQRVGRIDVRVGGNTQETATLVASTPDGKILEKDYAASTNPTLTPPLVFTSDVLQMMRNISDFVNVHWYIGVPFNDTAHWRFQIVEQGQAILGDYLIGVQAGNEPDLYGPHGHRPENYNQQDYFNEFGLLIKALDADTNVNANNLLIAPSVSSRWAPESILDLNGGFIPTYNKNLYAVAVEHYPFDNCGVAFPNTGIPVVNPQDLMPVYLSHQAALDLVAPYLTTSATAQAAGKPFIMFETNTASCGGFPGLSDAFVSALWGLDYAMQMAVTNFTSAMFHVGGQSVTYSPFTPPPTNESVFHQWSIGPIYYSALATAEALGATNTSQIVDLNANGGNDFTPAYGIWEHGLLARVLLINYANDPSGASDISVDITVNGGPLPSQVDVKYLLAANVTQKGNFTWAGQTLGGNFQADGRLYGNENITTVNCGVPSDGSSQTAVCRVSVPAPGAALVFLSGTAAQAEDAGAPSTTFSTSSFTKIHGTVWVSPSELASSNGRGGVNQQLGSTSAKSFRERGASITWRAPSVRIMLLCALAFVPWNW